MRNDIFNLASYRIHTVHEIKVERKRRGNVICILILNLNYKIIRKVLNVFKNLNKKQNKEQLN